MMGWIRCTTEQMIEMLRNGNISDLPMEQVAHRLESHQREHGHRIDQVNDLRKCIAELEAQLAKEHEDNANLRDKLACSTCLFRPIPNEPCPYASECCYSTGVGHAEGKNFWTSNTDYEELRSAAEGG